MVQKHSTSKFATKLKFKIYKPNKNSQYFFCVSTNTDINKLNWRFNHIFLVITNRDFYCMVRPYNLHPKSKPFFLEAGPSVRNQYMVDYDMPRDMQFECNFLTMTLILF